MARRHARLPDRPGTVCAADGGAGSGGIHARGTTGAADARRGDRPIGRVARERTDARPALHDQRQHRPAERRSGEMRPERHGGGRRKAFRGGEPAAGDLERLHFGRVGHRRRVAADPQRRVRPCLRRGIRPAVRFHRQRIQRLQIGKSRALPPLRRGARRADAGRSRRRGAAHDRPRAFGHGHHRGGRRHLQRREPHIGSVAHGRRTRVRNRRSAPRSVARRRSDRHGQSPRHGDALQRRDGEPGAASRGTVRHALQLAQTLFRAYARRIGRHRKHRHGARIGRRNRLRRQRLCGVRGALSAEHKRGTPHDPDGRRAENGVGIRRLQRRGGIPARDGPERIRHGRDGQHGRECRGGAKRRFRRTILRRRKSRPSGRDKRRRNRPGRRTEQTQAGNSRRTTRIHRSGRE